MTLGKYSMGVGDRFGRQGEAQLQAMIAAHDAGVSITPVWNKSYREHVIIHTDPATVRAEADAAVAALGWTGAYHVDADHISSETVGLFLDVSDYFTLDVAEFIGEKAPADLIEEFVARYQRYAGVTSLPRCRCSFSVGEEEIRQIARKYRLAVAEAGKLYRQIADAKGEGNFITEVSMDETDSPQTPEELFFILAAIANEGIPPQTIAPKFIGRFNKGVDYVGDVALFADQFEAALDVIVLAVREFDLPENLKLSVHSGSDKFSIYEPIHDAIQRFDAGLHLKTAGTTWLEELIGLASAGGEGFSLAKEVYREALNRAEELCGPYAAVIEIHPEALPSAEEVDAWNSETFVQALRHDLSSPDYNPSFRQLLHVGYKVAAEMGGRYLDALDTYRETVAFNVTENLFERHIQPVFLGNRG